MDENEVLGADDEAGTGMESILSDEEVSGSESVDNGVSFDTAALETKMDILTEQVTVLTDKVTGCYCMLLILAVLGLRNVFRGIIRKVRGGMEDV